MDILVNDPAFNITSTANIAPAIPIKASAPAANPTAPTPDITIKPNTTDAAPNANKDNPAPFTQSKLG